jgi:hypothetical protein
MLDQDQQHVEGLLLQPLHGVRAVKLARPWIELKVTKPHTALWSVRHPAPIQSSAPILRPRSQADKPPGEGEVTHLIRENTGKLPKDYRHAIDLLADLPHTRSIKGSLNCRMSEEISS